MKKCCPDSKASDLPVAQAQAAQQGGAAAASAARAKLLECLKTFEALTAAAKDGFQLYMEAVQGLTVAERLEAKAAEDAFV
jgi:hypothetical protein